MSSEDKLYDMLRRVPFDEMLPEFLENINKWNLEERTKYIHSKGWTREDFNRRWMEDLE